MPGRLTNRIFAYIYLRAVKPSKLPRLLSRDAELSRIAMARILVGFILLVRTALATAASWFYYEPSTVLGITTNWQFISGCSMTVMSLSFMIGVLTPLTGVLLLVFYALWDLYMQMPTLGTMIFLELLILLTLSNSGSKRSVDALLARGLPSAGSTLLRSTYNIWGSPSKRQIAVYYWLTFLCFAITNAAALTCHIIDPNWQSGTTIQRLSTSSLWCRHYMVTGMVSHAYPVLVAMASKCIIVGQSAFQLLMLPLSYTSAGMCFVIGWSLLFFSISWFALQLSYLAPMELVLWWLVLCPRKTAHPPTQSPLPTTFPIRQQPRAISTAVLLVFGLLLSIYPLSFPIVTKLQPKFELPLPVSRLLYLAGLWCPNVFNQPDLRSSDTWRVVYRCFSNGTKELVPMSLRDGSRGWYFFLDPLYFGNDLLWRRMTILSESPVTFNSDDALGHHLTEKLLLFDYKLCRTKSPEYYMVEINTIDPAFLTAKPETNGPQVIYQFRYDPASHKSVVER